ncbi:wings apart-like protein homolog [Centruroides vittatus]|uniref:wings apart-like protein homolog n=1 Tax=Centruroides vittatus TaxID=120091 RepID=UPI0035108FA6
MTSTTRNRNKKALNLSEISENNQSNLFAHDANTYGNHIMRSAKTYNSTNVKNLESNNCNKFQSRKKYMTRQQSRLNNLENEEIISNDKKTAAYGKHKNYHSKNNESITKGETKFEKEEDWKNTINQDDSFLSAKDKNLLSNSKSWKVPNCDFPSEVNKKVIGAGIFDCSIQLFMEEKSYCFGNDKSKDYSDESGIWLEKMSSFEECDSLEMKDSCQQLREKLYSLIERLKIHCHRNEKYSIIIEIIYCCTEKLFSSVSEEIVPEIISIIREMDIDSNLSLYVASLLYIIAKETVIPNNTSFLNIIIELIQGEKLSSFEKLKSFNKDADGMVRIQHLFVEENYNVFNHYLACDFALESLLKFVSKAQDDWYKKKFRHLGGLDIVIDIVNSQCKNLWNEDVSSSIQIYNTNKLGKCLNILQNAIFKNPDNQTHILNYKNAVLLQNIVRILQFCRGKLSRQNFNKVPAKVYLSCLSAILKLLVNITHKNVLSSVAIGDYGEVMDILLYYIISLPLLRKNSTLCYCF